MATSGKYNDKQKKEQKEVTVDRRYRCIADLKEVTVDRRYRCTADLKQVGITGSLREQMAFQP